MSSKPLIQKLEWDALERHRKNMEGQNISDFFEENLQRFDQFHIELDGLLFDYSKHRTTEKTLDLLISLATACGIEEARGGLFAGKPLNKIENRAALHPALRGSTEAGLHVGGEDITQFVETTLSRMEKLSGEIRSAGFTDIVHIGIGGSSLGSHMVCEALTPFANGPRIHFVSNMDGAHIAQTLQSLHRDNTFFIVASKTFSTAETLENLRAAQAWIGEARIAKHFLAVTANQKAARDFGILPDYTLPLRDWIGGRFSLWSSVGLPIVLSVGFENFKAFLAGARAADLHFKAAPLARNIPVIMAMLGIWYRNFWNMDSHAVLPYAQNLHSFLAWVRQIDMESNGKCVDLDGKRVNYHTGPLIFGQAGTDAQHEFFQSLHQGTAIIPADFIAALRPEHLLHDHNTKLLANALAQSQALMKGEKNEAEPHRNFEGNRPSSTILLDRLDPYRLGMLMALYEHKIFVQSVIWNINCFDQWGVELGKTLAKTLAADLAEGLSNPMSDSSTKELVRHISDRLRAR
ncbi:MAG: glucose-6-phosphate isomerase [Alphaproteobacteria bacterium]|nr:glucose-6-phosphate isomerase [Alphaproteobacteria bacterium]